MQPCDILKHTFSTIVYAVVLFFVLWANDIFITWGLHHFIGQFFNWFYQLGFVLKILFIIFAGSISLYIVFGLFMWVANIVGMILSYIFIYNSVVYYISIIMVLTNIVFSAIHIWPLFMW